MKMRLAFDLISEYNVWRVDTCLHARACQRIQIQCTFHNAHTHTHTNSLFLSHYVIQVKVLLTSQGINRSADSGAICTPIVQSITRNKI